LRVRSLSFESQIMTSAFDRKQFCPRWNHFDRAFDFRDGAERIARAVNEQRGRMQIGQMLCPLLLGTPRRMQRIREQQQSWNDIGFFGAKHARLAPAVGMAPKKDASGCEVSQGVHRVFQPLAVAGSVARTGWAEGSRLPVRKVVAQDRETFSAERLGKRAKQRRLRVAASTVGKDEAVPISTFRHVQKSANRRINGGLGEPTNGRIGQGPILIGGALGILLRQCLSCLLKF